MSRDVLRITNGHRLAAGLEELNRLHERLQRHPAVAGITTLHLPKCWRRRF